jgi:hypothetical protein
MNDNPQRVEEFKAEIDSMKVKASGAESEARLLLVGVVAAVVGVGLAILGGIETAGVSNEYQQRGYIASASLIGIALIIAGAALFVRYSLARYMRFWMVRLVHESRANTDRIVEAIERAGRVQE